MIHELDVRHILVRRTELDHIGDKCPRRTPLCFLLIQKAFTKWCDSITPILYVRLCQVEDFDAVFAEPVQSTIRFWTTEEQPERLAKPQPMLRALPRFRPRRSGCSQWFFVLL